MYISSCNECGFGLPSFSVAPTVNAISVLDIPALCLSSWAQIAIL